MLLGLICSMGISRRHILQGLAALPLASCGQMGHRQTPLYANAYKHKTHEAFGFAVFDAGGDVRFEVDLPERGHGFASHSGLGVVVSVSRRPGNHMIVVDTESGRFKHVVQAPIGRHFYGHAAFSSDGRYVYTTENAYDEGVGVIGVYETNTFTRIGEFPAHGIGPHELILMADGRSLAVAIGGIQTHPSAPRQALNGDAMQPALCFIDSKTGALLRKWQIPDPDLNTLSIRHIATNAQGNVAAAFQWEGEGAALPPLVGICSRTQGWQVLRADDATQKAMRLYCGSVAFASDGQSFIVSSPRGNLLTHWNASGDFLAQYPLNDGCGVAANPATGGFIASTGLGQVQPIAPITAARQMDVMWDNHLLQI